ncbi:MAG: MFS transporter [Novosphingobium sp.]|nr:MFS transporter [Novosphingobium sp.]
MSAYLSEFRTSWRPLLAATIGVGSGMSIVGHVVSAIAPSLIDDAGWNKADFAAIGGLGFVSSLAFPFIGRLADVLGVRLTALIGQVTLPLAYLAYSMFGQDIGNYIAIFIVQSIVCVTTTATVYTRLAVQYFTQARGLALAIVVSGSAVVGAIGGPVLNEFVEDNGWRASYQALAIFAAIAGAITFLLIPSGAGKNMATRTRRKASKDYPLILRSVSFWMLAGSMLLCNLPQVIMLTQLKVLILENGVTGRGAAIMFTALSLGMLVGRFVTGVALDRFEPYVVAFVTLGLPSLGLYIIATDLDAPTILTAAVFFLGFAFGAEGDLVAFLVAKRFGVEIYSSVMGLLTAIISGSASAGALLLSYTLDRTGNFNLFLNITGTTVLAGAAMLLLLRRFEPEKETVAAG